MSATLVEFDVLETGSRQDGLAAIGRLSSLGVVVLLATPDETTRATQFATELGDAPNVRIGDWVAVGDGRGDGWEPRPGGGRALDRRAVERLADLRTEHEAGWLVATDRTLASARACPGLLVACVGPAADRADPIRPDHQAHSLLDAVRQIEASAAFD